MKLTPVKVNMCQLLFLVDFEGEFLSLCSDVVILVAAVNEWTLKTQHFLEHQNADTHMMLGKALGHEVERLTGMTLEMYLGHVVAALKCPYQLFPQRNGLMRHVIDIIDESAKVILVAC